MGRQNSRASSRGEPLAEARRGMKDGWITDFYFVLKDAALFWKIVDQNIICKKPINIGL